MSGAEWIAVDWGTSNVRAWGIGADGTPVFSVASDEGMGKLTADRYPAVLSRLCEDRMPPSQQPIDVLICGMAGARQGWLEAPYVETPALLAHLVEGAVSPDTTDRFRVRILPGVCQRTTGGEDVMRGEETQLLGLLALRPDFEGTVVMPGTHSKWVHVEDGRIARFATAMTGELYDVLGTHSVLRHALGGERMGASTEDGVAAGLEAGLAHPEELTSLLFRTRAASLLSERGSDWCSGYLSGLLVGTEIGGRRNWLGDETIPLVGSPRLCRLYGAAIKQAGGRTETIDATEATLAGLRAARREYRT